MTKLSSHSSSMTQLHMKQDFEVRRGLFLVDQLRNDPLSSLFPIKFCYHDSPFNNESVVLLPGEMSLYVNVIATAGRTARPMSAPLTKELSDLVSWVGPFAFVTNDDDTHLVL
jgi:hypothetical protein